ncbi:pentatricopeptide repeat-containing protein At5g47360-like [Neltuma alba]|uniref:pentatricopeptide repeat-containing protein At5g47360-like n=1 Tax=Neltuma alba TaxID=207710 RepID=UPI0010A47656|nr:pentatricopeptide repeat-containing protein At5g47360-like [Prosopis alba]
MPFSVNYRLLLCLARLKNYKFSIQKVGLASVADALYSHLHNNSCSVEKSLSMENAKLDAQCVAQVLDRCFPTQPHLGIRFFIWAGLQSGYKHSAYMYKKASVAINRNPQVILDVILSYESEGYFVTTKIFKEVLRLCKEAQHADTVNVALWLLRKMEELNLCADTTVFNIVISLCCKAGDIKTAENLIKEMSCKNLYPDMITYMTMIQGFCKAGQLESAYSMLKDMKLHGCSPNSVVYTALLNGFCGYGSMERAMELWEEMKEEGGDCSPNVVTYTSLIQSFSKKGKWKEALQILDRMRDLGCSANHVTVSKLIDSLCSEGRVEEAYRLCDKVREHEVSYEDCYNSLVIALMRTENFEEAERLFRVMVAGSLKPDSLACSLVLKELCSKGRVLDGFLWLEEIVNAGCIITIDSDIYCVLLVGLYEQSHLIEAKKLAEIMLKKSIVPRAPYNKGVIEILRNSG